MVEYFFGGGPEPPCFEEADVNADEQHNISDIVFIADWLFGGGPDPLPCYLGR